MQTLLKIWLLPPAINIVAIIFGALLLRKFFHTGVAVILLSAVSLYLLSTPVVSSRLGHTLEIPDVVQTSAVRIKALQKDENIYIVVAGASHYVNAKEFDGPSPNASGLVRLHYAADLHHRTGYPILLTGGPIEGHTSSHAEVMAHSLKRVYKIDALQLETISRTTLENALFSAETLAPEGVKKILLVTQSYHMKRAMKLFEYAGFEVIPAATQLSDHYDFNNWLFWMPDATSLLESSRVIYEYIGIFWYNLILDPPARTILSTNGEAVNNF